MTVHLIHSTEQISLCFAYVYISKAKVRNSSFVVDSEQPAALISSLAVQDRLGQASNAASYALINP